MIYCPKSSLLHCALVSLTFASQSPVFETNLPGLRGLVTADPGLPRHNPTDPYWLSIPHRLANVQSPALPGTVDVVIIGSGITGASMAFHMLEGISDLKIAVLDARSLCSGATGRNGGQLVTYGAMMYSSLKKAFGQKLAHTVINFTFLNVEAVAAAAQQYAPKESEYRPVERIRCFGDADGLTGAMASIAEFEKDHPEESGKYTFIGAEKARAEYGIHDVAGAVRFSAGALWPYRFIMKIWETLLEKYPDSLTIDANTPVTKVTKISPVSYPDTQYRYEVHTPRGTIRAANVVYATNAYTAHLLPAIRGRLFPFRESMTVQDLNHKVPNRGNTTSWSVHQAPAYNATTKRTETGTLYLQQNAISGNFFFGGAYVTAEEAITSDDSKLSCQGTSYLRRKLSEFFGLKTMDKTRVVSEWTGIQGFTADGVPLVGLLPKSLTGRDGDGEWVAAGYNGGGMAFCWLVGKAVAGMMRREDVSDWFPEVFYVSEVRLNSTLAVEQAIAGMKEYFPAYQEEYA